ncbi:hypothetical protein [Pacificibacter sp. AS14]
MTKDDGKSKPTKDDEEQIALNSQEPTPQETILSVPPKPKKRS